MEEKKNNLGVVTIILLIIVLCLIGYIGYDKLIKKDTNKEAENNTSTETTNTTNTETNNNVVNNTTTISDYNQNENLKFYYYTTKGDEFTRYSLTLSNKVNNDYGFLTIEFFGGLEDQIVSGHYTIKNNKLILSFGPYIEDNNMDNEYSVLEDLGVTLKESSEQENYKSVTIDNKEDELKIGKYTFYKVK